MASVRVFRMALRQARQGNYKPVRFVLSVWLRGLTGWCCATCGRVKGPSLRTRCPKCQVDLMCRGLFDER